MVQKFPKHLNFWQRETNVFFAKYIKFVNVFNVIKIFIQICFFYIILS